MGDFSVVNVNGNLQKNGGNVASYFCTPSGRVIHAVGKPVQAERLLQEARWALQTYQDAVQSAPDDVIEQTRFIELAHLTALKTDRDRFNTLVQNEMPKANGDYQSRMQSYRQQRSNHSHYTSRRVPEILRVSTEITARRRAARRLSGDRAHQILAAQPLAPLSDVYRELFEKLTGERANDQRGLVYSAAKGLQHARESNLPVLLVFYNGHGENNEQFDSAMERLVDNVFRSPSVATPLQTFVVVSVPIRQIPALSNLAELPVYELPSGSRPALIITKPNGEEVGSMPGSVDPDQLASQLWPIVHQAWLDRAKQLASEDKVSDALRLSRKVQLFSSVESQREQATRQINDINMKLAEQWANRGNTRGAVRLWTSVKESSRRQDIREQATERLAQFTGRS